MSVDTPEENRHKKLRYDRELKPFQDFIQEYYQESNETVFRSTLTTPPSEDDSFPQSKRESSERGSALEWELTPAEVDEMSHGEKKEYVADHSLSVFVSMAKCKANVANITRHISRKFSREEAEVYLKDKRGVYIVEMEIDGSIGLIERKADKKGHKNLLLYEDVSIEETIVNTYGPYELDDFLRPDGNNKKKSEDGDK